MHRPTSVSDVGEKQIIREFIKPFFNAHNDPYGVGDDCAMVPLASDIILLSTDRVPADLTAFRLGILDYEGLGNYLARLNLSDIAACGGHPFGLLLNLGLPGTFSYEDVKAICQGFRRQVETTGCRVLGGDMTSSNEISISATSIGVVPRDQVLRRGGAKPGDSIFVSRPAGMTPAAFEYFLGTRSEELPERDVTVLRSQFTAMAPMLALGRLLAESKMCTSCMDNTDGIGQSLSELAEASDASFIVDSSWVIIPDLVARIASIKKKAPFDFLFNGGADFSLIGTLRGEWNRSEAKSHFGESVEIIGRVDTGKGVQLKHDSVVHELLFKGWNYFA